MSSWKSNISKPGYSTNDRYITVLLNTSANDSLMTKICYFVENSPFDWHPRVQPLAPEYQGSNCSSHFRTICNEYYRRSEEFCYLRCTDTSFYIHTIIKTAIPFNDSYIGLMGV